MITDISDWLMLIDEDGYGTGNFYEGEGCSAAAVHGSGFGTGSGDTSSSEINSCNGGGFAANGGFGNGFGGRRFENGFDVR